MRDQYGRNIDYLRISVTDRCNLRCTYCMPETGIPQKACQDILSYEEIVKASKAFAALGIRKIKLTGGEPLVRLGICDLIRQLKRVVGIDQVTLTTNGVLLAEMAEELMDAGVDGINISLDTLNPDIFAKITRKDEFHRVMAGIEKLQWLRHPNVKLNCVPIVGVNEEEIIQLASYARDYAMAVRFIELMPIGLATDYRAMSKERIIKLLEAQYGPLQRSYDVLGNGPAEYYALPGFIGRVGFIGAIHNKFCDSCNRIRLTSDGFLKLCLYQNTGENIRELIAQKNSVADLAGELGKIIAQKPKEHHFFEADEQHQADHRSMFEIGG